MSNSAAPGTRIKVLGFHRFSKQLQWSMSTARAAVGDGGHMSRNSQSGRWQGWARRVLAGIGLCCTALLAHAQGVGYWHTSGNQILDSNNQVVRIAGVNWYGFETVDFLPHGIYSQDYKSILNSMKSNGYNVIRLPFSNQMVEQSGAGQHSIRRWQECRSARPHRIADHG